MPRFAANLSTMYCEHAFRARFEAAAHDGFDAVECQFPYEVEAAELAAILATHRLEQVLINAPAGNWDAGERGIASLSRRVDECRSAWLEKAIPYALALQCPRIHLMAGLREEGVQAALQRNTFVENLAWAAAQAAVHGLEVLIEPINTRDMPGYFLSGFDEAHSIVREIGAPNLKVQLDLYHCQIMEGDLATKLRNDLPTGRVGHIQMAGVPDRHEPDEGEIDYAYLFGLIDELGWSKPIGCEYRPRAGTTAGLRWMKRWLRQ